MQPERKNKNEKTAYFKHIAGEIFKNIRQANGKSQRKFADEFEFDRGNLSKMEKGLVGCSLATAWKICEGANLKFSEFAKILEDALGEDFKLIDE